MSKGPLYTQVPESTFFPRISTIEVQNNHISQGQEGSVSRGTHVKQGYQLDVTLASTVMSATLPTANR